MIDLACKRIKLADCMPAGIPLSEESFREMAGEVKLLHPEGIKDVSRWSKTTG
ncbi:MAG: hypothetical protein JNJ77_15105 [Planctomycetia bacterium]|nr:hypothetical protein [Planctomycetia bacterium]